MEAPNIEVEHVSKTFVPTGFGRWVRRRRGVRALDDVSLQVRAGEIFGLVGRNGYGKTTLIKCITSLVQPTLGKVRVLGFDSVRQGPHLRRHIGLVSAEERSFYWRLTGRQNLFFFGDLQGVPRPVAQRRVAELAERFEVTDLLPRRFHEYSTGNRQRFAVIRALLHDPTILVLDEPTRSLDPAASDRLRRALSEWVAASPERSVLITSHDLAEVEQLSHRVGIMNRGTLREQGTLESLRERFAPHEQVDLELSAPLDPDDLEDLRGVVTGGLTQTPAPGGTVRLQFLRQRGDDALHTTLARLLGLGVTIRAADRRVSTLQDIVDHLHQVDLADA